MKTGDSSILIASGGRTLVSIDNFTVGAGRITFLFGESGIGKSLLSQALYGIVDPDDLHVGIDGKSYDEYRASPWVREVQRNSFFVFQEPSSHLNPLIKLHVQLDEGSLRGGDPGNSVLRHLWKDAPPSELDSILDIYPRPYRPSGGEKQRILLGMAFRKIDLLAKNSGRIPTFFVFDEPTGSLDNSYRNLFLGLLLERYSRFNFTALVVTHDYSIISEIYRTGRSFVGRIDFRELSRKDDGAVTLRDFAPRAYLSWLRGAAPAVTDNAREHGKPALEIAPVFRVFGKKYALCRREGGGGNEPFRLRRGETAYLKAPSGVGKTTLAKVIMGIIRPDAIKFELDGLRFTEKSNPGLWPSHVWGKRAGMVFQHADEALDLQATVAETFSGLPTRSRMDKAALRAYLGQLFDEENTDLFLRKKTAHLSGGQKQRLNILRTLALNTPLVILDEPLNGLDFDSIVKVLAMFEKKRQAGTAVLVISHNEEIFDAIIGKEHTYHLSCG